MSLISKSLRSSVEERAEHRCEYCHFPVKGQVATFPVDHVKPRTLDGPTTLENVALACPRCNGSKWKHIEGTVADTGEVVPLFNPRTQVWSEHFVWSDEDIGVLKGLTICGQATIARLQMNIPSVVAIRRLLAEAGLFDEVLPVENRR